MKEIQKLRERPKGISLVGLALGKNVDLEDEIVAVKLLNNKYTTIIVY